MACVNLQVKNEKQAGGSGGGGGGGGGFMGPRISFSNNDFINDSNHHHEMKKSTTYREAPVSSDDFEFSVPSFSSNSADEVFFKAGGKYLMKDHQKAVMTLRDELLLSGDGDDDDDDHHHDGMLPINNKKQQQNSTGWWREKFGLRKAHNLKSSRSSSDHKNPGGLETIDEAKIKPPTYFYNNSNFTGSNRYK